MVQLDGATLSNGPSARRFARKLGSAVRLLRTKGIGDAAYLTMIRAREFRDAHRYVPAATEARARLLMALLNRHRDVCSVTVGLADVVAARDAVLLPYCRHRIVQVGAGAQALGRLRPVEVAILADSMLQTWAFRGIADAMPEWTRIVAGTPFASRIQQTARRAALRLGRIAEAAEALDGEPDDAGSLVLRGEILDAAGRMSEARAAFEASIRRDSGNPDARRGYGFHLMKAGRISDGLASWGVAEALSGSYPLRRHRPAWTGEPLGQRRLMVLFEHGLGDMLQVARFLSRVREREAAACLFGRVPVPLVGLMRRAFPFVTFVSEEEREPDYDLFVPSMQLAAILDLPDLEPRSHYVDLGAPVLRRAHGRPRVGVCWRGHPRQYEVTRSIPLDCFAQLFAVPGIDVTVLLNSLTPAEAERLSCHANVDVPPIRDFVDLAGLVASCDLVVSVDTAVVHLAGAGGVPTLLLSRPDSCWRWGASGSEGPWYATVEVLRHGGDMDWEHMLAVAARRLRERCLAETAAET